VKTLVPDPPKQKHMLLLTGCLKKGKKTVTNKVRKSIELNYFPWEEAEHNN